MTFNGKLGWVLFVISVLLQIFSYLKVPDMFLKSFESRLSKQAKSVEMSFTKSLEVEKEKFQTESKLRSLRMDFYPRIYEEMYVVYSSVQTYSGRTPNDFYTFKNDIIKSHLLMTEECHSASIEVMKMMGEFIEFEDSFHSNPTQFKVETVNKNRSDFVNQCNVLMDRVEEIMRQDLTIG